MLIQSDIVDALEEEEEDDASEDEDDDENTAVLCLRFLLTVADSPLRFLLL